MLFSTVLNLHKILCFPVILGLIAYYNQWNNYTAGQYLVMHGVYGVFWVVKDYAFPDKNFQREASISELMSLWLFLMGYWMTPYILCSQAIEFAPWRNTLVLIVYVVGMFFHYVSDMQKYMHIKLRPGTLLDYGMSKYIRNPNYFGEFLIYLAFSLMVTSIWPKLYLAVVVLGVFIPSMLKKDKSLSRYKGTFEAWKARSWLFIPFIY